MSLFTADQLIAHALGDYVLQSDWMATEKTAKSRATFAHAAAYGVPFVALGVSRPSDRWEPTSFGAQS